MVSLVCVQSAPTPATSCGAGGSGLDPWTFPRCLDGGTVQGLGCREGKAGKARCPSLPQLLLGRTDASLRVRKLWQFLPELCRHTPLHRPCVNLLFLLGGHNEKNLNTVGAPFRWGRGLCRPPCPACCGHSPPLLTAGRPCLGNLCLSASCSSSWDGKSPQALLGECQWPGGP